MNLESKVLVITAFWFTFSFVFGILGAIAYNRKKK